MTGSRFGSACALAGLLLAASIATAHAESASERLAAAIRFETVSSQNPADFDPEPFLDFDDYLARTFARTHAALELEHPAEHSLLFTWHGSDPSKQPILLTAHHDVVPVVPGSEDDWTQPPFGGVIADGFIWGRGALDDKVGVMGILEAVEALLADGFAPARTVYLAFGHDEELGGHAGAAAITALLVERGVRVWFSLDEGMAIGTDLGGISEPVAMIGVAEKGSMTIDMTASGAGGHSSIPPRESAIGRLARVVQRVEANPMPAHLDGIAADMLDGMAPYLPASQRFAIRQRWLLGGFLERGLSSSAETNALVRTTTAVTMIRGGVKTNVLPTSATATVNFRVHPSDTVEGIEARLREIVDDPEIELTLHPNAHGASAVSSSDGEAYAALESAILAVYPGVGVSPALVLGGTDSKHYAQIADDSYRFSPIRISRADAKRLHGIDERIAVEDYERVPRFYVELLRGAAGP